MKKIYIAWLDRGSEQGLEFLGASGCEDTLSDMATERSKKWKSFVRYRELDGVKTWTQMVDDPSPGGTHFGLESISVQAVLYIRKRKNDGNLSFQMPQS